MRKINSELKGKEKRRALEAVGKFQDAKGRFASKPSYPDYEKKLKQCESNLEYVKAMKEFDMSDLRAKNKKLQKDTDFFERFAIGVIIFCFASIAVAIMYPSIDQFNNWLVNYLITHNIYI